MRSKINTWQILPAFTLMFLCQALSAQKYYLFTGTYTKGTSEGIYVYRFDAGSGMVTPVDTAKNIQNPSYLTISRDGKSVYAVTENGGDKPGQLNAFSFDPRQGKLRLLNQKNSQGDYPCYITVSSNRKWAIAANYGGGSLIAYKLNKDGSLTDQYQLIKHSGSGPNKDRQESPHVHSTVITPDGHYLLVPDLGIDKVMIYQFNEASIENPLRPASKPAITITPGNGPRHLAFHPNGKWVYLMEEMGGQVSSWTYKNGNLTNFQHIDAHPDNYTGERGSADIHISPDGKFLYASNRYQANNLAIYSINPLSGMLKLLGFQNVLGSKPRNFIIEPSGKYILVANEESNDIRIFKRDKESGLLKPTQTIITVSNPVCLQLLPIK
jgi:6-phosphogluconolactonase